MAQINVSVVPAIVTLKNTSDESRAVQLYRVNTQVSIPAGDELLLQVNTSNELLFWLAKSTDHLTVTFEAVEAGE